MLFLDSADRNEIFVFHSLGVIAGVTTNPTILRKEGIAYGDYSLWCDDVAQFIHPAPLSFEVTAANPGDTMLSQARGIAAWAENMVVKIPIHGTHPIDMRSYLPMIFDLEGFDVRVNVTAMMSAQQCYLAALAGATYVSLFGGRVEDMGYSSIREIEKFIALRDRENLHAKLIVGSVRKVKDVLDWLVAGADIVTVPPQYFDKMQWNPRTAETVTQFLRDANDNSYL